MTELELKNALAEYILAIGALPRSPLGFRGDVTPLRLGIYVEGRAPSGAIYVADPAEVAKGLLAWREWVTVRGGVAGGSQAVRPGGGNVLGGFGVAGLLQMLTGLPIASALPTPAPAAGVDQAALQNLLIQYLARR